MTPCRRKCRSCGNVADHLDNITPHVCCALCGSQDTRLVKEKPQPEVEVGPVYGCVLISELPLGVGGMIQQMPTREDLQMARKISERTVAGYEVLLSHYRDKCREVERLNDLLQQVSVGDI